ncbi:replication-relaxation family protein [Nocardia bovistercoris]|uniref:Replication-relaxation family protein n=1 Tax=Nocardia bovistercoris TaxID=2785916 RepID=A0A931IFG5_9NOCA|nr:replication-relaxation family protein [Nocardia bovistercoris]MBH0779385.1 replication-relaxation family protein [Nocardia bovistercoris]
MTDLPAVPHEGCPAAQALSGGDTDLCELLRRSHFDDHLDRRIALSSTSASPPVDGQSGRTHATTDADFASSSSRPRRPASIRHDLTTISKEMSERDFAILRSVAEHRFLTVRMIHQLHFHELSPRSGLRITQRTLARLRRWRVLGTLERRIGGLRAGSGGLVHYVDLIGAKLLQIENGEPPKRRYTTPSTTFLSHTLAIAETHITLLTAQLQGRLELIRADIEAVAWRTYHGLGGALLTLRPDMYLETAAEIGGDLISSWFFEQDMGTESIPTLVRKSREYENYRRSGTEQDQAEGVFPLVIWSLTARTETKAEQRRLALVEAIERDQRLDGRLFRIIAPHQLIRLIQTGGTA